MTWEEALESVVGSTGHARYRELCAEGNPDAQQRDSYRRLVVSMATGEPLQPPSAATMAGSAIGSAARFVASGLAMTDAGEHARRLAICGGCEFFRGGRCMQCGCYMAAKAWGASERCPIGKW